MRRYVANGGQVIAASATETMLVFTNDTDQIVEVTRIRCGQDTHTTAEMYLIEAQRASAAGSGGSGVTPTKKEIGDPASDVAVTQGPTGEPTYTANTVFLTRHWNSVLGMEEVWTGEEAPVIPPSGIFGVKVTTPAGITSFTPDVEVEFTEKG